MADPADFPFEFACRRSGNCCAIPGGVVRVDDADVRAIAAYLGMSAEAVRSRFVHRDGDRLLDGLGSRCVFLGEGERAGEAHCTVYPVRPQKCRDWPFWPEALERPELLAAMQRRCPGITERA
ncbi:MAG: YkgJ family cysteine cluster protein [bacterium]|nr:YkgJ family cysteine cluster protein [bacterium]